MVHLTKCSQPLRALAFKSRARWHHGVLAGLQVRGVADEATLKVSEPYKFYKIHAKVPLESKVTRAQALQMYERMAMIRRIETASGNLYKEKFIRGFCHLYSGMEGVAVGLKTAMQKQDTIITSYRDHGWAYLMGVSPAGVLAELTGREAGCARGKGGSMHMYAPQFYGGNGIVGAQCSVGAGIAFGHKYLNDKGVCVTLYGDGAANQGQLFEALNMAKLWDLPCLYVCENNIYAMGTSAERSASNTKYYTRGDYVPGIWVDGMDPVAMVEGSRFALEWCRSGKGPIIMEACSYRYSGHSMSDPGTSYRTRDEVQEVRKSRDPIGTFKEKIIKANLVTDDELKAIDKRIREEVDKAVQVAKDSPEATDLAGDTYNVCYEDEIRGTTPMDVHHHSNIGKPCNLDVKIQ